MLLKYIDFDRAEWKICRNYVDKVRDQGKAETLKNVGYSTVYRTDESKEEKEDVEGAVLGGGGDEVSVMSVVYSVRRLVSHQ